MYADASQHQSYIDSSVFKDHIEEIKTWLKNIHEQMEVEEDSAELYRLQGSAKACRNFLHMPTNLLDAIRELTD